MVHNTSSLVMNNLEGQEYRRSRNRDLEKAGVCMPGAGLVYTVSETDFEDIDLITDFSERVGGEISILFEKIVRLELHLSLLLLALMILTYIAILWPGVMKQHEAVLNILMSKVGPTSVVLYIWRELVDGAVYAKWKAIKHDWLELVRRVNDARRRLPVVACINADERMINGSNLLNMRCHWIVIHDGHRISSFWLDCVTAILFGLLNCTLLILWFSIFG